ncbi:BnaC01g20070D [Brassica napus]|uniref:Ribosomal protein L15 n=1 Tax=Brassica napus TaxID=3708 RepID=A0A078HPM9_BRANA|nr:BnaC01g20070D [Brassica napus]
MSLFVQFLYGEAAAVAWDEQLVGIVVEEKLVSGHLSISLLLRVLLYPLNKHYKEVKALKCQDEGCSCPILLSLSFQLLGFGSGDRSSVGSKTLALYFKLETNPFLAPVLCETSKMGAYKYVSELWRKKQSDVMRFVQRVRCWEYRQQPSIVRLVRPTRPDKARRLGYKAKQGFVVYRVRVRRGGRKRPVPKGIVYGKPTNQGVTQLKFQRSKRSVAEERAGRKLGGLRVVNSYWLNEDSTYKYYEIILVDPAHNAVRNDPRINWICNPVHKHRELRGLTSEGKKNRGLRGKGHNNHKNRPSRRATWKKNNSLSLRRYR